MNNIFPEFNSLQFNTNLNPMHKKWNVFDSMFNTLWNTKQQKLVQASIRKKQIQIVILIDSSSALLLAQITYAMC